MNKIVLKVRHSVKERLGKTLGKCRNAGTRLRYLMIINVINGRTTHQTAAVLHVHLTTVGRVVKRLWHYGEAGLHDGRAGGRKGTRTDIAISVRVLLCRKPAAA
jgi:hypothetical protein